MKKKILFGILFSAILAINVISVSKSTESDFSLKSLIQISQAQTESDCYPWSPNYNFATGRCDLDQEAPSGLNEQQGDQCVMTYWDTEFGGTYSVTTDIYEIDCIWAVVGTCTPKKC